MYVLIAATVISHFVGQARNKVGELLFTEHYKIERVDGHVSCVETIFEDVEGEKIATLRSEFKEYPHLPETNYERKTLSYGAKIEGPLVAVYNQTKKSFKSTTTEYSPAMVAGHGFYFFLLDHLEELLSGKEEQIDLLQPDKLTTYHFRVRGSLDATNPDNAILKMELKNPLLRKFVPPMVFTINTRNKSLVAYSGIDGFAMVVDKKTPISITYSQPIETQ